MTFNDRSECRLYARDYNVCEIYITSLSTIWHGVLAGDFLFWNYLATTAIMIFGIYLHLSECLVYIMVHFWTPTLWVWCRIPLKLFETFPIQGLGGVQSEILAAGKLLVILATVLCFGISHRGIFYNFLGQRWLLGWTRELLGQTRWQNSRQP